MKRKIILSALTASILASFTTQAADTADLSVIGVIRPTACTPSLANGGRVDYGTIAATELSASQLNAIGKKTISFSVNCSAATTLALRLIDNQSGSVLPGLGSNFGSLYPGVGASTSFNNQYTYGLGTVDGTKIGGYFVGIDYTSLSGVAENGSTTPALVSSNSNGGTEGWGSGSVAGGRYFASDGLRNWKAFSAISGALNPGSWSSVAGNLDIYTVVDQGSNLPLSQEINLNGSATLEVMYL